MERLTRYTLAVAGSLVATLFVPPAFGQGQRLGNIIQFMAEIECSPDSCPQPLDPMKREGFVLRLSGPGGRIDPSQLMVRGTLTSAQDVMKRTQEEQDRRVQEGQAALARFLNDPVVRHIEAIRDAREGRFEAARQKLENVIRDTRESGPPLVAAAANGNLGAVAAGLGDFEEARRRTAEALERFRVLEAGSRPALARGDARLGEQSPERLLADWQWREAQAGWLRVQLNLANLFAHLGQYGPAREALDAASRHEAARTDGHSRVVIGEYAALYRKIGPAGAVDPYLAKLRQPVPRREEAVPRWAVQEPGVIALGGASVARSAPPSNGRVDLKDRSDDEDPLGRPSAEALALRPSQHADAAYERLAALALQQEGHGQLDAAAATHSRMALLAASSGHADRERVALANLQRLAAQRRDDAEAVFHGKRAVNLVQRFRGSLGAMTRQERQSFLTDKRRIYVGLVQALLDSNRLAEAEQVLRLLKEDEGQQFLDTGAARRGRVSYTVAEAAALTRYDSLASRTQTLEAERERLRASGVGEAPSEVRAEAEAARREELRTVEERFKGFEGGMPDAEPTLEYLRRIVAKPAASRTADEVAALRQMQASMGVFTAIFDTSRETLQGLLRDGPRFVKPLTDAERARIDAALKRLAAAEASWRAKTAFLATQPPAPPSATSLAIQRGAASRPVEVQRLWQIDRELEAIDNERSRADAELRSILAGSRAADVTPAERERLESGRRALSALPAGTVALYFLSAGDRTDVLLVSADARRAFRLQVSRDDLERRVQAFRRQLQDPRSDVRPLARELHSSLMAPLLPALAEARAETLMLSLDGALRYLPFAALYDGRHWLAEDYALNMYTTAAPGALAARPAARWRVVAFGRSAAGAGFSALPAVREELRGIVREGGSTTGVLPGVARMDAQFTEGALRDALRGRPNVLHIASHFRFTPGDLAESYLLLGDDARLSLARLGGPEFRFDGIDLVTLSACETGLVGEDAFGQEVEGLATLLQAKGAAAVLATLWSVVDDSTAQFMRLFYAARESQSLSRAQALRAAQRAFIRGIDATDSDTGPDAPGRGGRVTGVTLPAAAAPEASSSRRPFAHPFYWAPFLLMGNWL